MDKIKHLNYHLVLLSLSKASLSLFKVLKILLFFAKLFFIFMYLGHPKRFKELFESEFQVYYETKILFFFLVRLRAVSEGLSSLVYLYYDAAELIGSIEFT